MLKPYSGMFIFLSSLSDEELEKVVERVRAEIGKQGGRIHSTQVLGRRTFARRMQKHDAGWYVRIYAEMETASVAPLLARFKLSGDVFRAQITRIDKLPAAAPAPQEAAHGEP